MAPSKTSSPISFTEFFNVVDGKLRSAKTAYHGINPTNKEKLWNAPVATKSDLEDAVKAARRAFPSWAKTPIEERKKLLVKWEEVYKSYAKELIKLLIKETGKPRQFASSEVHLSNIFTDFLNTLDLPVEEFNIENNTKTCITKLVPVGIVGAICPWNFPVVLAVAKILPALLAGNCVILKPSPFTPYTALKICEMALNIFPPGVFQVLGGDENLGSWMTYHLDIDMISFTGSVATGKKVMAACSGTIKRVNLELGGNDPSIVCPDVDIDNVAIHLVMGSMFNSGQMCIDTKRIYIHQDIYKPLLMAMSLFAATLKVGGDEKDVVLGPIQNAMQYDRVKGFFEEGKAQGWKYATGGELPKNDKGFFIVPTIVDNPPNDSRIIQEEPFGPIVPCQPWTDEDEVISRANDTRFGLGASVWSKDVARARRIGDRLEAGTVWINSAPTPDPRVAFGGHKQSGLGAVFGSQALRSYCNVQSMHITH